MATIEEAIYALLTADAGVGQLLSTRIYPQAIPQDAALPAVAYQRISGPRILAHDGPTGMARARIQITVQGTMYSSAKGVAEAIRQALDGYKGPVVVGSEAVEIEVASLANEIDGYEFETAGEVIRLDFVILYNGESVGSLLSVGTGYLEV